MEIDSRLPDSLENECVLTEESIAQNTQEYEPEYELEEMRFISRTNDLESTSTCIDYVS